MKHYSHMPSYYTSECLPKHVNCISGIDDKIGFTGAVSHWQAHSWEATVVLQDNPVRDSLPSRHVPNPKTSRCFRNHDDTACFAS